MIIVYAISDSMMSSPDPIKSHVFCVHTSHSQCGLNKWINFLQACPVSSPTLPYTDHAELEVPLGREFHSVSLPSFIMGNEAAAAFGEVLPL